MKQYLSQILFCSVLFTNIALASTSPQTVYVYADQGVSAESLAQILHTSKTYFGKKYNIRTIKAHEVIQGQWRKDASLFIMPGGADLPYLKALKGQGNQQIKAYVEDGGSYLGICAGGYYGSQNIVFAEGTPIEIKGQRELAFFHGTARGPALAPYDINSNKGARAAHLTLSNHKEATVYYNGGSFYEANPMPPNTTVIARYADLPQQPAAIIKIKVGKGIAILSGVHFEYDQRLLPSSDPYLAPIKIALKSHENQRQRLVKALFDESRTH